MAEGLLGSVFQIGLPWGARIWGFKNPRLLRDRPTDGAALARKSVRVYGSKGLLVRLCMAVGVRMQTGLPRDVKSIVLCSVSGRRGVHAPYRDASIA